MIERMMNFWQGSIKTRLIGYFMLLALTIASVGPFLTFTYSKKALETSVINRLHTATTLKESELNRWVSDREKDITLLSQEPALLIQAEILLSAKTSDPFYSPSYQNLSAYFQNILNYNDNFSEIFLLTDVGGKIVLSTNHEQEGEYRVTDKYFTEGRLALYSQHIYPSPTTGKPIMTIAIPVINRNGQHIGVLAANLNMKKLDEIILERAGLGKSGETYLVDQFNSFVSATKYGENKFPRGVHTTGIDAALSGKDGAGLYLNYEDIPVVGVYQWVDGQEIALLAEISQDEAFALARELTLKILLIGLASVLLAGVGVYFVAQQITRPILAITATATEIAGGDLSQSAPVLTKDEIGILAQSFNSVTTRVRELINTLEERVEERTRALKLHTTYLKGAAEVSRAAATFTDSEQLSRQVVELIREYFDFYYVGLFLVDKNRKYTILKAGSGKEGERMLAENYRLKIDEGMIGWAIQNEKPRIASDISKDTVRKNDSGLSKTRSEAALPLRSRGHVFGALTVQSNEANAFTSQIITTLQTMADQIAVAFDNAELLAKSEAALEAERRAYGEFSNQSWRALIQAGEIPTYKVNTEGVTETIPREENPEEIKAIHEGKIIQKEDKSILLPIKSHGKVLGGIRITQKNESEKWTKEQIQLAETLAEQLSVALESARLFEETQRKAQREAIISDISTKIGASIQMDSIIQTTVKELGDALNVPEIAFRLTGPQKSDMQSEVA